MPADYSPAAAALSLSISPSPPRSPNASRATPASPRNDGASIPSWTENDGPRSPAVARRLSTHPYSLRRMSASSAPQPLTKRIVRAASALTHKGYTIFLSLTPLQRGLVVFAAVVLAVLSVLGLVYSHEFFAFLVPVAQAWRELPFGWALLWLATFATAFPPMIGYSSTVSMGGFVFGFPWGWPIVASASVAGSLVAFWTSRGIFSGYVHRLVGKDKRFVALGQVLRRDGLGVLTMIRFCPLPFSLSNGFLATIPSIRPWAFALATALSSPKLAVHVFIGSRLALVLEEGDKMSTTDKVINYSSMVVGGLLGLIVGLLIYRRTMARAAELAAEEAEDGGGGEEFDDDVDDGDEESRLVRNGSAAQADGAADVDAAALMDEDDISLWENDGYRDSWSTNGDEEAAIQENGATNGNGTKK